MGKRPSGIVLYHGPSEYDGKPIVVIAVGIGGNGASKNPKTGTMLQTYILRDNGLTPLENALSGADSSICGTCPHRARDGKLGSCYVNLGFLAGLWKKYRQGKYPTYNPAEHDQYFRDRHIRFGSYGDPAAVPLSVWHNLKALAYRTTGYTHNWLNSKPEYAALTMASVETREQAEVARWLGYRTFRVLVPGDEPSAEEISCPASAEAGKRRTCETCGACKGSGSGKSIAIQVHGLAWKATKYAETVRRINLL